MFKNGAWRSRRLENDIAAARAEVFSRARKTRRKITVGGVEHEVMVSQFPLLAGETGGVLLPNPSWYPESTIRRRATK